MSLKNDVKVKEYVLKTEFSNGAIITVCGTLAQTCIKENLVIQRVLTTPGGKVLAEGDVFIPDTFENQPGIRKELSMGYSVCLPEDNAVYDYDCAVRWAKNHYSRPLVTFNFTYLNADQIHSLMKNEAVYVANRLYNDVTVISSDFVVDGE